MIHGTRQACITHLLHTCDFPRRGSVRCIYRVMIGKLLIARFSLHAVFLSACWSIVALFGAWQRGRDAAASGFTAAEVYVIRTASYRQFSSEVFLAI